MTGLNRDELTKLIYDNELFHGTVGIGIVMDMTHIEKFAELVATAEREACAKLVYEITSYRGIADAIRARGQE